MRKQLMRILNSGLAKVKRLPIWTWRLGGVMLLSSLTLFGWSRMPDGKGSKPLEEKEIMVGGIEFIYVKGGTFQMGDQFGEGSDDELPVHPVRVNDFYMSKYEITFDQYDAFCEATDFCRSSCELVSVLAPLQILETSVLASEL
ncbi:SUMF1/EgtB/PvdO family nonheme iron enzyme [candidate division KSB1 bacterium]|nr:SUMF1/EgtB/PvdO family nonheme iron enzyme [candidate division KSB1 bacterium]